MNLDASAVATSDMRTAEAVYSIIGIWDGELGVGGLVCGEIFCEGLSVGLRYFW